MSTFEFPAPLTFTDLITVRNPYFVILFLTHSSMHLHCNKCKIFNNLMRVQSWKNLHLLLCPKDLIKTSQWCGSQGYFHSLCVRACANITHSNRNIVESCPNRKLNHNCQQIIIMEFNLKYKSGHLVENVSSWWYQLHDNCFLFSFYMLIIKSQSGVEIKYSMSMYSI